MAKLQKCRVLLSTLTSDLYRAELKVQALPHDGEVEEVKCHCIRDVGSLLALASKSHFFS